MTHAAVELGRLLEAAGEIGQYHHLPLAESALAAERALAALHYQADQERIVLACAPVLDRLARLIRRRSERLAAIHRPRPAPPAGDDIEASGPPLA